MIPRNVQFIDGSAFCNVKFSSIGIESGNHTFVVENDLLIDIVCHKLIRNFSRSSIIHLPNDIEILGSSCFSWCGQLSSISFESNSRLTRIESHAFDGISSTIAIPYTVLFIASDPGVRPHQLLFAEGHRCEEFDGWLEVRESGISVDFRRILRFDTNHLKLISYELYESVIKEMDVICECDGIESCLYRRIEDNAVIVVESIFVGDFIEDRLIEKDIEKLINLCHSCIASPIGFVFAVGSRELKVLGIRSESESLGMVLKMSPVWWTPTAKAKAVVGLVLGLRFAHSLGLIHGHLTTNTIVFDLNHQIQITNFLSYLSGNGLSDFSREGWNPEMDIRGFLSILSEIIVGFPVEDEANIPADVPKFVCEMIKSRLSDEWRRQSSFLDIFETLKQNNFGIVSGVDTAEVCAFVGWVEEFEQCRE
jgi:hypothetical protein